MTLQQFIDQYNGKKLDFDGNSGAQCVDVAKKWAQLNSKPIIRGNAINWAKTPGYVWVANTPTNKPNPGDLIVFNIGKYGHISVAVEATTASFKSFDQNFPVGSPCKLVNHSYRGVLGWLRVLTPEGKWATVNKDAANVRLGPNTKAAITSVLHRGDRFQYDTLVDGEDGKWIHSLKDHYVWASGINY